MWTRKRTVIAGRAAGDDDWEVLRDRHRVGRVYVSHLPEAERRWQWVAWGAAPAQGYAPSLEVALEEVRAAVLRGG